MKHKRKLLPVWLIIVLDLVLIGSYVGGFYGLYYLKPRQLEGMGIQTVQKETTVSSSEKEFTSSDTSTTDTTITTESSKDWATKYAEHFTEEVVTTENSYSSNDISITVNKYTHGSENNLITYYVADIYVANIKCLQSGFADNTYGVGYTEDVLSMDSSLGAILAINGDYYGNGGNGVVIRNGEVYRTSTSGSDVCVLDENGSSLTQFTADRHIQQSNPRSAIGYYEPGHYCLVVVDGRQKNYSVGMTLSQLSDLFEELGCNAAYNLDGGKSSEMTFNDDYVNQPADGGRDVSDCIFLKEVE